MRERRESHLRHHMCCKVLLRRPIRHPLPNVARLPRPEVGAETRGMKVSGRKASSSSSSSNNTVQHSHRR